MSLRCSFWRISRQINAGKVWHQPVRNDNIGVAFANQLQRAPSILGEEDVVRLSFERIFRGLPGNGRIIHDEDAQRLNAVAFCPFG